jgi:hypothetical protein
LFCIISCDCIIWLKELTKVEGNLEGVANAQDVKSVVAKGINAIL